MVGWVSCLPQDIAAEFWAGRGRERKQRLITVDGFQVLRENNYTLNEARTRVQQDYCSPWFIFHACMNKWWSRRGALFGRHDLFCINILLNVACSRVPWLSQGEPSVYGREAARPAEGGYKKRGRQVAGKDYTHSDLCQARYSPVICCLMSCLIVLCDPLQ